MPLDFNAINAGSPDTGGLRILRADGSQIEDPGEQEMVKKRFLITSVAPKGYKVFRPIKPNLLDQIFSAVGLGRLASPTREGYVDDTTGDKIYK